jgi:hypothetical protein
MQTEHREMTKKVRIHRDMTEDEKLISVERMVEVVNAVGGRKNLEMLVPGLSAQEISNVKQKQYVSPQIAIRIEKALLKRYGSENELDQERYKRFTRYYFCPDLTDLDFDRVELSMQ